VLIGVVGENQGWLEWRAVLAVAVKPLPAVAALGEVLNGAHPFRAAPNPPIPNSLPLTKGGVEIVPFFAAVTLPVVVSPIDLMASPPADKSFDRFHNSFTG